MADLPPPTLTSFDSIYDKASSPDQRIRYANLRKSFVEAFNEEPQFFARAPGRVNLIGEHIDYSGYSVLPMAVENDIIMAVSKQADSTQLHLKNVMSSKYQPREYNVNNFQIDTSVHEWSNYFLAGFKRLVEDGPIAKPVGMKIVVDGHVPAGAGLSSSSAMVCCSVLAACVANGLELTKKRIAEIAILGERYVGVESGGMDQSISMMAERGKAKLVDFNPLAVHDVNLPQGAVFVIANSMVTSDKKVTAPRNYNLRVVECRLASVLLNKIAEKELTEKEPMKSEDVLTLIKVQHRFGQTLEGMLAFVKKHLHPEPYKREEVASLLGMTVEQLHDSYMSKFPIEAEGFELFARATHVFSESLRVYQFKEICDRPAYAGQLKDLGDLMNASQASCKDFFNCSCPELDTLTQLCRDNGAVGSRLTGAGWGGCSVSLVEEAKVTAFIEAVRAGYFAKAELQPKIGDLLFASRPGNGALILKSAEFSS